MKNNNCSFLEIETIVRLCGTFLTSSIELDQFLRELAELIDAEVAMAVLYDRCSLRSSIVSAGKSAGGQVDVVNQEAAHHSLTVLRSPLPKHAGVFFSSRCHILTSLPPWSNHWNHALVLSRCRGSFSAKNSQCLGLIHSAVHSKLTTHSAGRFASSDELPPRIQDVKDGLLDGLSDKQIAARLRISPHTVHTHIKSLFKRQGVSSRAELLSAHLKRAGGSINGLQPIEPFAPLNQLPGRDLQLNLRQIPAKRQPAFG